MCEQSFNNEGHNKSLEVAEVGDVLYIEHLDAYFIVYQVDIRYANEGKLYAYKLHKITEYELQNLVYMQKALCDYNNPSYAKLIDMRTTDIRREVNEEKRIIEIRSFSKEVCISATSIYKNTLGDDNEYNIIRVQHAINESGSYSTYLPAHWQVEVASHAKESPYMIVPDKKYEVQDTPVYKAFARVNKNV